MNVKIADNQFVAIDYRLTLESGEEFDRSAEGSPLGFVTGTGSIIPGLESALAGRSAGESFQVTVEPEAGYGHVQKELLQAIPRDRFPADVEITPGMQFHARGPRGPVALTVVSVDQEQVNVDLNHPLAGKRLTFDVKVQEVREPLAHEMPAAARGAAAARRSRARAVARAGIRRFGRVRFEFRRRVRLRLIATGPIRELRRDRPRHPG